MTAALYKEVEFGSRRNFELRGTKLHVEKIVFRGCRSFEVDLTDCVPTYTVKKGMHGAAFSRATTYLTVVLILAIAIHGLFPAHRMWVIASALLVAYPGIYVAIRSWVPIELLEFRDSKGNLLIDFLRPRKQVPQINLDEFIAKIRSELIKARQPNQLPEPMSGLAPGHGSS